MQACFVAWLTRRNTSCQLTLADLGPVFPPSPTNPQVAVTSSTKIPEGHHPTKKLLPASSSVFKENQCSSMETEQQTRGWANVHPVGKLSVSHCSHWTTFQTSHDYSCTKCQPALPSYLNPQLVFKTASHTRPLQTQHKNTISKGYDHTQILCKSSRSFVQSVSRQFLTQAQHLELSLHAPGNA